MKFKKKHPNFGDFCRLSELVGWSRFLRCEGVAIAFAAVLATPLSAFATEYGEALLAHRHDDSPLSPETRRSHARIARANSRERGAARRAPSLLPGLDTATTTLRCCQKSADVSCSCYLQCCDLQSCKGCLAFAALRTVGVSYSAPESGQLHCSPPVQQKRLVHTAARR